jgi:hypothetical protein
MRHKFISLLQLFFYICFCTSAFAGNECKIDLHAYFGAEKEILRNQISGKHVYFSESQGGLLKNKRYCRDGLDSTSYEQIFLREKIFAEVSTIRGGSYAQDIQVYDEQRKVRIVISQIGDDFARAMVFAEDGKLAFFANYSTEMQQMRSKDSTLSWYTPVEAVNQFILEQFSGSKIPQSVIMVWLSLYHGEGAGMTIESQLTKWKAEHPQDAERLYWSVK